MHCSALDKKARYLGQKRWQEKRGGSCDGVGSSGGEKQGGSEIDSPREADAPLMLPKDTARGQGRIHAMTLQTNLEKYDATTRRAIYELLPYDRLMEGTFSKELISSVRHCENAVNRQSPPTK